MNKEEKIHIEKCNKYRQEFIDFIKEREKKKSIYKQDTLTSESIYRVISKDGLEIINVPVEYVDYKLCKLAVKQNGEAIKYIFQIPVDINYRRMLKLCKIAIGNNPSTIQYLPKNYRTEKICYKCLCKAISIINKNNYDKSFLFDIMENIPNIYKYGKTKYIFKLLSFDPDIFEEEEKK